MNASVPEVTSAGTVPGNRSEAIVHEHGNRTYVIEIDCGGIGGEPFEDQLDSLVARQRRNEKSVPLDQMIAELGFK